MASIATVKHGKQKRAEFLEFIISFIDKNGYPPTVREIGEGVNLKSTSTVYLHLLKMDAEGIIEMNSCPRAIKVPGYKFVKE